MRSPAGLRVPHLARAKNRSPVAVKTQCPNCKNEFSAQDDYLGKKVKCPRCGDRVSVVAPKEREAKDKWHSEQEERLRLLERLAAEGSERPSLAVAFGTGSDRVRNYNPGAVSRFRKLRALSRFMILCAYLIVGLFIAAGVLLVGLHRDEVISTMTLWGLLLVDGILLVFSFCLFKFLGELSYLLADVGDHQLDVRNLLIDLREDAERWSDG